MRMPAGVLNPLSSPFCNLACQICCLDVGDKPYFDLLGLAYCGPCAQVHLRMPVQMRPELDSQCAIVDFVWPSSAQPATVSLQREVLRSHNTPSQASAVQGTHSSHVASLPPFSSFPWLGFSPFVPWFVPQEFDSCTQEAEITSQELSCAQPAIDSSRHEVLRTQWTPSQATAEQCSHLSCAGCLAPYSSPLRLGFSPFEPRLFSQDLDSCTQEAEITSQELSCAQPAIDSSRHEMLRTQWTPSQAFAEQCAQLSHDGSLPPFSLSPRLGFSPYEPWFFPQETGSCLPPFSLSPRLGFSPYEPWFFPQETGSCSQEAAISSHATAPACHNDSAQLGIDELREWAALESLLNDPTNKEREVVQVLEKLEQSHYLHEGLPCMASEFVFDSYFEGDKQVALSSVRDVIAQLQQAPAKRRSLKIHVANVTTWRREVKSWVVGLDADLVLLQETHLTAKDSSNVIAQMQSLGWDGFYEEASGSGRSTSGGLLTFCKRHLSASVKVFHRYMNGGKGFQLIALRCKGFNLVVGNIYLKSGVGFLHPFNSHILAHLSSCLGALRSPFFIAGDYNEDRAILEKTRLADSLSATWMGTGHSTATGSGEIDFSLVSRALQPALSVRDDWEVPFKPHTALCYRLAVCALQVPVPQLVRHPSRNVHITGAMTSPANEHQVRFLESHPTVSAMTAKFANLSARVEQHMFGEVLGIGARVSMKRAPLVPHQPPFAVWKNSKLALWERAVVSFQAARSNAGHRFLHKHAAGLIAHASEEGHDGFQSMLQAFMRTGEGATHLLDVATSITKNLKVQTQKDSQSQYKTWLQNALQGAMRPLFRAMRQTELVCDRPFREHTLDQRVYHRWTQWHAIWGAAQAEVDQSFLRQLHEKAVEQGALLQPIPFEKAKWYFHHAPLKASGLDGWSYEWCRQLTDEAIRAILDFLHACEAQAEVPDQFKWALIVLLPKNATRERPIGVLHVLYRSHMKLRYNLILDWQQHYRHAAPWDQARPGTSCLEVALRRQMRCEQAKLTAQHNVSLLLDLETFYDRCSFSDVIENGLKLQYPPLLLSLSLQVYGGPRVLLAENTISPPVGPTRGLVAGCPLAPSVAKLVLHPVADSVSRARDLRSLDLYIDDLSCDFAHKDALQVAKAAIGTYRRLHQHLVSIGQKPSVQKTVFICSSAAAARQLKAVSRPDDPKVVHTGRDLGLEANGARRRSLAQSAKRHSKAAKRGERLKNLAIPLSHRIRVYKASVSSVGLWGHQNMGVSPKRRKWFRTCCGSHIGVQKLGSLDVAFLLHAKQCEDPVFTIIRQHFKTLVPIFQQAFSPELVRTWSLSWQRLIQAQHPWKRVAGPLAATQAYLIELGIDASNIKVWTHRFGALSISWDSQDTVRQVLHLLETLLRDDQHRRIASSESCQDLKQGIDPTVPRRLLKRSAGVLDRTALKAVYQGALISSTKPGWCKLCKVPLSLQHIFWDCLIWENWPSNPSHWKQAREQWAFPCLWNRGLIPRSLTFHPEPPEHKVGLLRFGLWEDQDFLGPGYVYSTDATGGPGGIDARDQVSAYAIAAFTKQGEVVTRVAYATCLLPCRVPVPVAEQYAALQCLQLTHGCVDITIDCKLIAQIARKPKPPPQGEVPWGMHWDRVKEANFVWVPSHKSLEEFMRLGHAPWRHHINEQVDMLCKSRALEHYMPDHRRKLRQLDRLATEIGVHLARKAAHILKNRNQDRFPWILSRHTSELIESAPIRSSPKVPNKRQLMQALIPQDHQSGHVFRVTSKQGSFNMCMVCDICSLFLQQVDPVPKLKRLMSVPCLSRDAVWEDWWQDTLHPTHDMCRVEAHWKCRHCSKTQKPGAENLAKALSVPCKPIRPKASSHDQKLSVQAHTSPLASFFGIARQNTPTGPEPHVPGPQSYPALPKAKAVPASKPKSKPLKQAQLSFKSTA